MCETCDRTSTIYLPSSRVGPVQQCDWSEGTPSAFRCIIDANGLRRADHTWGLTALRDRLPIPDVCLGISGLRHHDRGNRPEEAHRLSLNATPNSAAVAWLRSRRGWRWHATSAASHTDSYEPNNPSMKGAIVEEGSVADSEGRGSYADDGAN